MRIDTILLLTLILAFISLITYFANFVFADFRSNVMVVDYKELALNFSQNHTYCMFDDCLGTGYIRYNCVDFTHDLVLLLRENNYSAYPICGWLNHFSHAWVGIKINNTLIQIEPQTGEIIIPQGELYKYGHRCLARGLY